jgi:hypothetical protein
MTMCMREGRGGELLWVLNMTICGMGGVLLKPLSRLQWGYGRISEGDKCYFLGIPNLSWETTPRLDSGMMCGVQRQSLRKFL